MRAAAAVALALLLTPAAARPRDLAGYTFEAYAAEHNKRYVPEELGARRQVFEASLAEIIAFNEEYAAGRQRWWKAPNALADWTAEEFARLRNAKKPAALWEGLVEVEAPRVGSAATEVDWRTNGVLTPVKDQGACGSCWAFATTATLEAHYAIDANTEPKVLAPQALVNCMENPNKCGGTGGCEGAIAELGFNFTTAVGLPLENDLPYTQKDGTCAGFTAAVKSSGWKKLPTNSAEALAAALQSKGPMAVNVAAMPWKLYSGGIFDGCKGTSGADLDHVVQAVGYTSAYWIVRNSWGSSWGERGYIYISRAEDAETHTDESPSDGTACYPYPKTQTVGGMCGILFDSSYPTGVAAAGDDSIVV